MTEETRRREFYVTRDALISRLKFISCSPHYLQLTHTLTVTTGILFLSNTHSGFQDGRLADRIEFHCWTLENKETGIFS